MHHNQCDGGDVERRVPVRRGSCKGCRYVIHLSIPLLYFPDYNYNSSPSGALQISTAVPQAFSPALSSSALAYSIDKQILGGNLHWLLFFIISSSSLLFLMPFYV